LTLREKHKLKVFKNRMLSGIFGPKKDKVIGSQRRLHKEELRNLYCLPSVVGMIESMMMRWAGHVGQMVVKMNTHRLLVGKPEGKETSKEN
jgi:hypothetical protein